MSMLLPGAARIVHRIPLGLLLCVLAPAAVAGDTPPGGAEIYQRLCVRCHGAQGQGVPGLCDRPLQGAYELADLIQIVDESMPEDDPDQCRGADAESVARYIFETFYASSVQDSARPARIELARLTVRQYQQAVADLVATFLGESARSDERGLRARYYNAPHFARDKLVLERVEPLLEQDFGQASPVPDSIDPAEFAAQWQGAVWADETGDYEFTVRTPNGARLFVNDLREPLLDAWVVSGDVTQHTVTVRLLGGRAYPLRVEFAKTKPQTHASMTLQWQRPRHAPEVIPERCLLPHSGSPTLVVTTPFPPDDRSTGYERGTSVSREWDQAQTLAAVEVANFVVPRLARLADVGDDGDARRERMVDFCQRFAERAFRRPLTDEQRDFFVNRHFADQYASEEAAVKRVVLLVLLSPRFLYVDAAHPALDDYDVASRLSFGLWDSLPDAALLDAAARGELRTPEQVAQHARRMLDNDRTRAKLRAFLQAWLNIEHVDQLAKDRELFGEFDDALVGSLRDSLDLFLTDVIWHGDGDFRQLLRADYGYVDNRIAAYYGLPQDDATEFRRVSLPRDQYAGILTHPYLMARLAYHKSSSPIHRGVFVVRSLLGRFLKPPPIAVAPADEALDPQLTTRERVARQTSEPTCQTCHGLINALGFAFEHYDAVGKYRLLEKDQPVNAAGSYTDLQGSQVEFRGARELAEFLAASPETHRCFVRQLFHYVVKQPVTAYEPQALDELQELFLRSNCNIRELLVAIVQRSALQTGGAL
ncbi:MAG: DUF1592 domain-containing protein [Pirellulaceae bacterium]|nr:DUF1592 domain-containing protein [Pirellulaceae bacterium]